MYGACACVELRVHGFVELNESIWTTTCMAMDFAV